MAARIRCTVQVATVAAGRVALMASGNPVRPSQQTMSTSRTPRLRSWSAHPGPEFRALGCLHPDPEYVFDPVEIHPDGEVRGSVADLVAVADLHHQRIQVDDRVDLLQRPRLPGLDLVEHRVGDLGDGVVGQLGAQRAG